MRYRLFTLLLLVALLGAMAAMFRAYSWFGLTLLQPHAAAVFAVRRLLLQGQRNWGIALATSYLSLWAATATFGTAATHARLERLILAERWSYDVDHGPFVRLDHDPMVSESLPQSKPPWYYLARGFSPCPCIVTIEYGSLSAPTNGRGGQAYYFWFFSEPRWFREDFYWLS